MGADMLLAACAMPHMPNGRQLDWPDVVDQLVDRVKQLDDGVLAEVGAAISREIDEFTTPLHIKSILIGAAHRLFADFTPLRRDVVVARFCDIPYLCTGGMSWGDAPTDAFDDVLAIQVSGITDDPFDAP